MKAFCSSITFLYVVVLLKNIEIDPRVTTFQTLELCFFKAFVSTKHCCIISLTYIFKMLECLAPQCFFMVEVPFSVL
jgi:hypothetical protein